MEYWFYFASVLLVLILFFTLLPHFSGSCSWLSMASAFVPVGASLQVAANGTMWLIGKGRKRM